MRMPKPVRVAAIFRALRRDDGLPLFERHSREVVAAKFNAGKCHKSRNSWKISCPSILLNVFVP